jgi:phosphoribosyl-ATP pyrophosphohydrolase/phosphoribosyl-AMP cyclohydrolase
MKAQPVFTDSKELIDFINTVKFDTAGLVPAVVQDVENNEVLMVAWMNQESLRRTLESGQAWFYSRKRQALWLKGETSGNYQYVREVRLDCDGDTLLLKVDQVGVACHLGTRSCFSRLVGSSAPEKRTERIIADLYSLIKERQKTQPEGSYTVKLIQGSTPNPLCR